MTLCRLIATYTLPTSCTTPRIAVSLEYQVLDMDFNVVERISAVGIGTIVATDDDGNAYGAGGWASDGVPQLHIVRAHFVQ